MTGPAGFLYQWGEDHTRMAVYAEKFAAINPLLTAGWHSEIDEPLRVQRFIDPEELRGTRFYREFAGPLGWCDIVAATIEKSPRRCTAISSTRGEEAGMTGKRELEIMGLLAPHLRRAVTIHETLDVKDRRLFGLSGALDLAPSPIFLLDGRGELQEANRAAERFLAEEKAAKIEHSRLIFTDAKVRSKVAAAVAAAAKGENNLAAAAALRTASGRAFAMEMLPLTSPVRQPAAASGRAVLALFIQEVGGLQPLHGEVLVKLYGLTPAETRPLVLIAQGMNLPEAADTLGVSETTVKTHMQRVFDKTGTHRQAEVVNLRCRRCRSRLEDRKLFPVATVRFSSNCASCGNFKPTIKSYTKLSGSSAQAMSASSSI